MKSDQITELKLEAEHFYFCLFGSDITSTVITHYIRAHECLEELCEVPAEQLRTVHIITRKKLKATAVEPWLRRNGMRHVVSVKLLLISYLAECSGENSRFLLRTVSNKIIIVRKTLGGLVELLYGLYLKVRYGLV